MSKQYILGYGSLMETASRIRTTPEAKEAYPVKVTGFKRGWFARTGVIGFSPTYLGCVPHDTSVTNGVVYEVSAEEIKKTDEREKGYTRVQITLESITDYAKALSDDAKVWIYVNSFPDHEIPGDQLPSREFPIVQSYVDICMNGCIEIEDKYPGFAGSFIEDFVRTTAFWSPNWANDRIYPRRPFIYCPNAFKIDKLLQKYLLDTTIFNKIYIE